MKLAFDPQLLADYDCALTEEQYRLSLSDLLALCGVENAKVAPGYRPLVSALKKKQTTN